ncbi:MAG: GerMN domain-containing protein [Anaerocolumna sp.]
MFWGIICALSITVLTACQKDGNNNNINNTPSPANTLNTTTTDMADNQTVPAVDTSPAPQEEAETLTIQDYYPFQNNVVYQYEGKGNEYAAYNIYTDYIKGSRIQLRSANGGSESIKVLEIKDGELIKILLKGECYYRENLLNSSEGEGEVLLKEPLTTGTEWMISGNRRRYISNTDVAISTPAGDYKALEVTTEGDGDATLDYYVRDVGLVKTIFTINGSISVTSSLSKIEENTLFKQNIRLFYPNADEEVIYALDKEISFNTNDITRNKLETAVKEIAQEKYDPLLSVNTKINSLYLSKDNVVYVDFSKELFSEMNAGAAYESMILQCIANTLGTYYGVNEVYITVEGKPYESGHISMKKGDTIAVKLDKVKE